MLRNWILNKLEPYKDCSRVLLKDHLRLLGESDSTVHGFARENGFTVIVAATNLVFRELYDKARSDTEVTKLLVIDRAPARRKANLSVMKAPPPFYPDLLAETSPECRINLDLRQFLKETTGDENWPMEANEARYASLIVRNLQGVIRAHSNLRAAHSTRFQDQDFRTIVAYATLGIPEAAFKKMDAQHYWKIGLLSYGALEELETLTPEITKPIKDELRSAPAPFCHFANRPAEHVIKAFYLSVILAQHSDTWNLLLANIDPELKTLADISPDILHTAAPQLIDFDRDQAHRDLLEVEKSFTKDSLKFLLIDTFKINTPSGFLALLEQEKYSNLIRSLTLLIALKDLISASPVKGEHEKIHEMLFPSDGRQTARFCDTRQSPSWSNIKEAYRLANEVICIRDQLAASVKNLKVMKVDDLSFSLFRETWNNKEINRIEYYLSALQRLIHTASLLDRNEDELPTLFSNAIADINTRLNTIKDEVYRNIDDVNERFQDLVVRYYPQWVAATDTDDGIASESPAAPLLTSQFLEKCLKPYWDPSKEKAVLLVFDGMRYDIWDEFLRPVFEGRMKIIKDLPASSLLPSETHITRKAIFAGTFPDSFDTRAGEDALLKDGLLRVFGYTGTVDVTSPGTVGTGETVRYRAGNLDVYIFELCDKELHKIPMKTLPDGRSVPSRPLSFVYEQHLKNIIDTEVMAIIRGLTPGTKVFVTADHGFGQVARNPLSFEATNLNEPGDCSYLNCRIRVPIADSGIPGKTRKNIIAFTPDQIRMPKEESVSRDGHTWLKQYGAIVFPKTGFSFKRPGAPYKPDAFTHGGISIQELMIPMIVLLVKDRDEGMLILDDIIGPQEIIEGEEVEFRLPMRKSHEYAGKKEEIRVDIDGTWSREPGKWPLPRQVTFVAEHEIEAVIRFRPDSDDATPEERRTGFMGRILALTVSYREGYRNIRKVRIKKFCVHLNSEKVVRRIPPSLGTILGLTPKSMR
ncbi:MAG: PglZ domain protein [Deltaproteobacteria bacterium ADurb.Bin135]|nr:MAG: PglZ domain protein [Deltaproteobacteria bacterium ADurb.Bin135]